jgi:L-ascorbate metabolism protein UlaG (beta-lactamase superfamily)
MRKLLWGIALVWLVCAPIFAGEITVTYLGHSCFTIQAEDGPVIMIDPYATYVPYPALPKPADVVLITHGHIDHDPWCFGEIDRVVGDPVIVWPYDTPCVRYQGAPPPGAHVMEGEHEVIEGLIVRFVEASHVTKTGGGQGLVCLFSFEVAGVRFAHLGDLGRPLNADQIEALGDVDVLFVPVGGSATIDAREAVEVIEQLPTVRIVIPMHYFVEGCCPWTFDPVDVFAVLAQNEWTVRQIGDSRVTVSEPTLPEAVEVWVMEYASE